MKPVKVTIEGQVYEYDPERKVSLPEAIGLQKTTGWTPEEWEKAVTAGDAVAMAGLVWLVLRRAGQAVKMSDIERMENTSIDLDVEFDEDDQSEQPDPTGAATTSRPESSDTDPSSNTSSGSTPGTCIG